MLAVRSDHEYFRIADVVVDGVIVFLGTTTVIVAEVRYG